ncbi:MAG: right-handed parallel beta-helix repeat-containing protein, partial [Candidatus Cloacimonetes bacterium]|nr:right-handed parallel beta-helix repeat-containing protein [Candidatus Cloacimonadota bacterium]
MKKKRLILILGISLFFSSLIFAGPNENAGITFDLNATTYGNQNLLQIPTPNQGSYIRLDIYAQDVVNLDTYEFEVVYNPTRLQYIASSPSNPITYEPNFLTINGGQALGWMVDTSIPGVLSIAYTLTGSDTLEAPEGEGLIADIVFQTLTNESTYLSFGNVYYHDSYGTTDEITSTVIALLGGLAPMPPADLTSYPDTVLQNAIRLTWIDPTENVDGTPLDDLAGINVYYADGTHISSVNPGVETYAVQGLNIGEYYTFYVTAYDNETPVNESLHSNTAGAMVIAPMPPSDFSAYSDYTSPSSIQLSWTDPTENINGVPLTDLNHIDVYYSDGTLIVSVNPGVESYTDVGLTDGQLYSYYLIAVADNPNMSNPTDTVNRYAGGSPIPSPPGNLNRDVLPNGIIQLTWDDPTTQEDGTPLDDLAGINIYLADIIITSLAPGVENYTFTDLIPGQYYSVSVTAYDNEIPVNESEPNTVEGYNTTVLYVHPDSTLNSIQTALNYATHHDTVLVAAGTYYEHISWPTYSIGLGTQSIHLKSESGPEVTIIDGGGNGTVIYIDDFQLVELPIWIDNTTIIEGFTIRNGNANISYGSAFDLRNGQSIGASPTIRGNIITQNSSGMGSFYCHAASPIITENIITQNNGNAICLRYGAHVTITGNTITQNSGCGIYNDVFSSTPTIIGNTITHNGSHGISIPGGGTLVENNVIANNEGLGIHTQFTCGLITITDNIITGNLSGGIGGSNSKSVTNCVVSNNGGYGIGGGVWFTTTTITNSIISNNDGDGVTANCYLSIHYCDIYNNNGFGLYNSADECMSGIIHEAQNNWWGDPDGPFGPNGDGVGCAYGLLEDRIYYTPWLTEPHILKIVSVPDFSCGEPEETITIPVNTTDITGEEVLSTEFALSYDSTIITAIDIDASGTLLSGTDWTWDYSVVGDTLFVEMSGADELTGSGTLINLIFVVSPDAQQGQESPLHFEDFIFNEGVPVVTTQDGIFIVGQIFGAIEGIVAEAGRSPIPGAVVTAQGTFTYCDTTDANGYYIMPEALSDTYDMTVIADGYNEIDTTGVVVIGGEITVVNFQLTHPEIVVYPASIDLELPVDITYDTPITISNPGNGPLDFYISIGEGARFVKSIEFKPSLSRGISSIQQDGINPIQRDVSPEGMKTGALFGTLQLAPNAQSGTLEPWQGFPHPSPRFDEVTIHYDGEPYTGIGLTNGGTFEGAIRLTPDELGPYDEWELISARFYHYETGTHSGQIKIYGAGSSSEPGAFITSEPYSVTGETWFRTDLTEPVTIDATQDLWTSVEVTHNAGEYPLGLDAGPAVQGKGDFIYQSGVGWDELYIIGFDYNWNVRAIVAQQWLSVTPESGTVPAGQPFDIIVHFDTHGIIPDSTYTTNILIHNNSAESPVIIPVTMHVTGPGQQLSLGENWNWISFNVHPDDTSIESVFAPLTPDDIHQVMNQTQSATYYYPPGSWYGTLEEITDGEGYLVEMNNFVNSFIVCGESIDPATPIALNVPWNWIAYYPQYTLQIEDAMASIVPNVYQVMNQTQSATYYDPPGEWYGSLEQMESSVGYKVKMNATDILIYPGQRAIISDKTIVTRDKTKDPPDWEVIQNTQCHMVLMAEITLDEEEFEGTDNNMAGAFCWIDSLQ